MRYGGTALLEIILFFFFYYFILNLQYVCSEMYVQLELLFLKGILEQIEFYWDQFPEFALSFLDFSAWIPSILSRFCLHVPLALIF